LNIIVKSGAAIEEASRVTTVVFDKTGTLTSGEPSLAETRIFADNGAGIEREDQLLELAAAVELLSPHVLAASVVKAARARDLHLIPATEVQETPGTGLSGTVNGRRLHIGS